MGPHDVELEEEVVQRIVGLWHIEALADDGLRLWPHAHENAAGVGCAKRALPGQADK